MKTRLLSLACIATVLATASVRAGTFTSTAWTGDASSGITAGQTVWAFHLGTTTPATINGVSVGGQPGPAISSANYDLTGPNQTFTGDTNNLTALGGTGSAVVAASFVYNSNPAATTVTVKGLTSGVNYVVSLFSVGWQASVNRVQTFASGTDSAVIDQQAFGADNGIRVDYAFTATAATRTITITPQVTNNTWHFYGIALKALPLTVTNTNDSGAGSLRQALLNAAAFPGANTITFAAALDGGTITLTSQIVITDAGGVTLDAMSLPAGLTISGGNATRLFLLSGSGNATLSGLTLSGGTGSGGDGGAILKDAGATLTLTDCTLSNNSATGRPGGAIHSGGGTLTLTRCTLSNNSASSGGAVGGSGTWTLTSCTLAHNTVTAFGGALYTNGTITVTHCTLSANTGTASGGGIYEFGSGALTIQNSIIAGNSADNNGAGDGTDIRRFSGTLTNSGGNLIGVNDTVATEFPTGALIGTVASPKNAQLATLANAGGRTHTLRLLPASPAREASSASTATIDQRGFPIIGVADSGAYEMQLGPIADASTIEGVPVTQSFIVGTVGTLSASSGNQTLLPDANITFGGSGSSRTITLTPAAAQDGSALVTVIDSLSGDVQTFSLIIVPGEIEVRAPGVPWREWEPQRFDAIVTPYPVTMLAAQVGGTSEFLIKVRNVGTGTLRDLAASFSGLHAAEFAIYGTLPSSLGAAQEVELTVAATPAAAGTRTATFAIASNDIDENPFVLNLILTAVSVEQLTVSNTSNSGPGSLRDAVAFAELVPGPNTLILSPSLSGQTITLSGQINVRDHGGLTIDADGLPGGLTIAGDGSSRLFHMSRQLGIGSGLLGQTNLFLSGITLQGGRADHGGAIFADINQIAQPQGGRLTVTRCLFIDNQATGNGGAIYKQTPGPLSFSQCTFVANTAAGGGGAIYQVPGSSGFTTILCTFSGNSAGSGGGGAVKADNFFLQSCTLSGNSAPSCGSGVHVTSLLDLRSTILAGNTGSPDLVIASGASATANNLNLIGTDSGNSFAVPPLRSNPLLAPLGNYGGRTPTMALLPGSPARNASTGGTTGSSDQRGFPIVGVPDIGAYEAGQPRNFNAWAFETLGHATTPAADDDHDGRNHLLEYATTGNPLGSDPAQSLGFSMEDNGAYISLPTRYDVTDVAYEIQRSTTLGGWTAIVRSTIGGPITPLVSGVTLDDAGELNGTPWFLFRDTFPIGQPRVFYRMAVTQP